LLIFKNAEFGEIRTVLIDNEPWFVGKDVAAALGYKNTKDALARHCRKDVAVFCDLTDSLGRKQQAKFINEGNLYRLIIRSKLSTSEKFEKWVFDEVLPQIHKTGGYIPVENNDDDLTIMAKAHLILERTISEKDELISVLQPKADTFDMVMRKKGTYSMNAVAKQIGIGEYTLFKYLRNKKILFIDSDSCNIPYEIFCKRGYFKVIQNTTPNKKLGSVTRVTQKGVDYICKLIKRDREMNIEIA